MEKEKYNRYDSPNSYNEDVLQSYDDTCAIKSQQIVLQSHGIDVSEDELREEAMHNGWYFPGEGTPMADIGNLLVNYGIEAHKYVGATTHDLAEELLQGHQVIVGVDSGELWNKGIDETFEDIICGPQADHALLISGFAINSITGSENILLTDPGTGEMFANYPVEQFEDAWDDSGNYMVSVLDI